MMLPKLQKGGPRLERVAEIETLWRNTFPKLAKKEVGLRVVQKVQKLAMDFCSKYSFRHETSSVQRVA